MKAGRNAPCPCGSGKKFKKCCMSGQATKTLLLGAQEIAEEIRKEFADRPYATSEKTVGRCYAFRSLEGFAEFFGLAEIKVLSKEFLMRKYEIKKSPLLDALVTFRV